MMTSAEFKAAVGRPLADFAARCHSASLALVQSGALGECRARPRSAGRRRPDTCPERLGMDCYDPDADVVDPTLWSYDSTVKGVWTGKASERPHDPFGSGSIWEYGKPGSGGGQEIVLDTSSLSASACAFLDLLGPLDRLGWSQLAHAPVGDWPSAEILAAMYDDDRLAAIIPIDIVGMATDRNPSNLYLRG